MLGLGLSYAGVDFPSLSNKVTYSVSVGDTVFPSTYIRTNSDTASSSSSSITLNDNTGLSDNLTEQISIIGTVEEISSEPMLFDVDSYTSHRGATSTSGALNGTGDTQTAVATFDITPYVLEFNDRTIDGVLHQDATVLPKVAVIALKLETVTYDGTLYNTVTTSMNLKPIKQDIIMTLIEA